MTYLRVVISAILRYRLEEPYRRLFAEKLPNRKQTLPFGVALNIMRAEGVIDRKTLKDIMARYKKLSRCIHRKVA